MKASHGSALVIVLSLLGVVSVLVMHAWFITGMQYDIVLQRELWHKNFYATEMLLNVALAQVSSNFEMIAKQASLSKEPVFIDLSQMLEKNKNDSTGKQEVVSVQSCNDKAQEGALLVRALYLENKVCMCQLQCLLKKTAESEQNNKEIHFVASHFTLGAGV